MPSHPRNLEIATGRPSDPAVLPQPAPPGCVQA